MKNCLFAAFVCVVAASLLSGAEPARLSVGDHASLMQKAEAAQRAFESSDAEGIIRCTHPAILKFFASREQFEAVTRQAIQSARGEASMESSELGTPTGLYASGTEDVTFLPKTMIVRVGDKRARSVSFLIAARQKGTQDWLFLDSASLRKDPSLLWKLFPDLPKDVVTPTNRVELLR